MNWALATRQQTVGLLAVASERRKTERAIDAILKLLFWYVQVIKKDQDSASTRALPDSDGVVRQDSGNSDAMRERVPLDVCSFHQRLDKMEICSVPHFPDVCRCSRAHTKVSSNLRKDNNIIPHITHTSCFMNSLAWYAYTILLLPHLHAKANKLLTGTPRQPSRSPRVRFLAPLALPPL